MKRALLAALCGAALFGQPLSAQIDATSVKGSYILIEEGIGPTGRHAVSMALLNFNTNGSVTGVQVVPAETGILTLDVQGGYVKNGANGTLYLTAMTIDEEGNPVPTSETYQLLFSTASRFQALRDNPGFFCVATVVPAAANTLKGDYIFSEKSLDRPFARIAKLSFDPAGNVTGRQIAGSQLGESPLSGAATLSENGFGTLRLASVSTGAEGDVQSAVENYVYLSAADAVWLMRMDADSPGFVILLR